MNNNKVALVTGGSSGIGRAISSALFKNGFTVYELSRRDIPCEGVTHITADVTNESAITSAISLILKKSQKIDLLVNCAGFGISGAIEFTENSDAKRLFDVNFFGVVAVTKEILPIMRQNKNGRIINISSVAAVLPVPFQAYYSACKSAINSYTEALSNEVANFGITVCAIMPGDTKTGFTASRKKECAGDDVYKGLISKSVSRMEHDEQNGTAPESVADTVIFVANKKRVKPFYTVGLKYKFFVYHAKFLPHSLINRLLRILYAK